MKIQGWWIDWFELLEIKGSENEVQKEPAIDQGVVERY